MTVKPIKSRETAPIQFRSREKMAEIFIYGDIGFDITAKHFAREFRGLGSPESVDIHINSFGGDAFDGVAIHSLLTESPATINVTIDGIAASAASVIAMAGDNIRIAQPGVIMIHNAFSVAIGNAEEMRRKADKLEALSLQMAALYQRRTGVDIEQIIEWMAEETEFSADEAVANGFADEIFESKRIAAKYIPERHPFKHTPTVLLPDRLAEAHGLVAKMRMQSVK